MGIEIISIAKQEEMICDIYRSRVVNFLKKTYTDEQILEAKNLVVDFASALGQSAFQYLSRDDSHRFMLKYAQLSRSAKKKARFGHLYLCLVLLLYKLKLLIKEQEESIELEPLPKTSEDHQKIRHQIADLLIKILSHHSKAINRDSPEFKYFFLSSPEVVISNLSFPEHTQSNVLSSRDLN